MIRELRTRGRKQKSPECALSAISFAKSTIRAKVIEEVNDVMSDIGRARSLVLHDIPAVVGGDPPDPDPLNILH